MLKRILRPGAGGFKRGQQALEYAVFVSAVSLALVVMFAYAKRGLQAAIKGSADQLSSQRESEPLINTSIENEEGSSNIATESNDTSQITKTGGQKTYITDSFSNSYGNTLSVTTEF